MTQNSSQAQGLCSIEIGTDGIAVAYVLNSKVITCAFHPYPQSNNQVKQCLTDLVLQHNLKKTNCCWVLHSSQYHLLIVNTPNVPPSEYKSAVRWQVKNIVSYPLEDVVVDIFYSEDLEKRHKKIYAVAAQNSFLQSTISIIQECYLKPIAIDICEFAIRNLITNLVPQNQPVGFLNITNDNCLLVIAQFDRLRFVRHIPVGLKKSKIDNGNELTMEIQRSFNYCSVEIKQEVPTKFFMPPSENTDDNIKQNITKNLDKEISILDLQKTLHFTTPIDLATQARCWFAVGGALRK